MSKADSMLENDGRKGEKWSRRGRERGFADEKAYMAAFRKNILVREELSAKVLWWKSSWILVKQQEKGSVAGRV